LPVGDVDGMARAAVTILSDAARWQAMSETAAADARARFALDAVVSQYEALYERAVGAGRAAARATRPSCRRPGDRGRR
jgi:glycosyltransferase involved in cell wall biosynthesis